MQARESISWSRHGMYFHPVEQIRTKKTLVELLLMKPLVEIASHIFLILQ